MTQLTMSGSNNFPLWVESIAENSSDKKALQDTENRVRKFRQQLVDTPESTLVIADSALYHLSAISWGCSKDIEIAKVKLQKKFKIL